MKLGQAGRQEAEAALQTRAAERQALAALGGEDEELGVAVHRRLAEGPSSLVTVQADDLAGEETAINVPGTDTERPNWRRRLSVGVEALFEGAGARILDAVRGARGT